MGKAESCQVECSYRIQPQVSVISKHVEGVLIVRWDINVFNEDVEKSASRSVW